MPPTKSRDRELAACTAMRAPLAVGNGELCRDAHAASAERVLSNSTNAYVHIAPPTSTFFGRELAKNVAMSVARVNFGSRDTKTVLSTFSRERASVGLREDDVGVVPPARPLCSQDIVAGATRR